MKYLKIASSRLSSEKRWDIDYHFPPIEINKFNSSLLCDIDSCATVIKDTRNPSLDSDKNFIYIDISSIDTTTGMITNPQELQGEEAPSRARRIVKKNDIIISTCRPTRGAIAIVPEELDDQICSTGFCVIRCKPNIDVRYLHFILRSNLVKEQFRKFSTGSSYPAILDTDVKKTIIPIPNLNKQKAIANMVERETEIRNNTIKEANKEWTSKLESYIETISNL